jgi:hypothetical protein
MLFSFANGTLYGFDGCVLIGDTALHPTLRRYLSASAKAYPVAFQLKDHAAGPGAPDVQADGVEGFSLGVCLQFFCSFAVMRSSRRKSKEATAAVRLRISG